MNLEDVLHELNTIRGLVGALTDHLEHGDGGDGAAVCDVLTERLEALSATIDKGGVTVCRATVDREA